MIPIEVEVEARIAFYVANPRRPLLERIRALEEWTDLVLRGISKMDEH
jgi:hypothetical protein